MLISLECRDLQASSEFPEGYYVQSYVVSATIKQEMSTVSSARALMSYDKPAITHNGDILCVIFGYIMALTPVKYSHFKRLPKNFSIIYEPLVAVCSDPVFCFWGCGFDSRLRCG